MLGLFIVLSACSSNTFDDLQPIVEDPMEEEPVEEFVTYQDVKFVFDNTCTACHSNPPTNGAPVPFSNYIEVRNGIINNGILDRVSRSEGDGDLMPLGGPRLPQSTIDLLNQWNDDGLLEN